MTTADNDQRDRNLRSPCAEDCTHPSHRHGEAIPYIPPRHLSVVKGDTAQMEAEIDRLSVELDLAHRDVKTERQHAVKLADALLTISDALNHEQARTEGLERDIKALRENNKLYAEWRESDGNTIRTLTRENEEYQKRVAA